MDADTLLTETETIHEQTADYLRDSAHLFHDHEGELFTHEQAIELLSTDLDIDSSVAQKVLTQLVGDHVDPVIQVNDDGTKYIGVAEFHEFDGAYGYVTHHDLHGKSKCVVCQQCVNCVTTDSAVTHVAEHELTDSVDTDVGWSELLAPIHDHYQSHAVAPTDVDTSVEATGATLKSRTTIGGNLAFHKGNTTDYTNSDAQTAVSGASIDGNNFTGVNKYTNSDARSAVAGSRIDGSNFTGVHNATIRLSESEFFELINDGELISTFSNEPASLAVIVNSSRIMNKVASSQSAMQNLLSLTSAANQAILSPVAMNEIASASTAMSVVASSDPAMDQIADREIAMTRIAGKQTAIEEIANSSLARGKVLNSPTAMSEIAQSSVAMSYLASDSTVMNEASSTVTAMNQIASAQTAVNKVVASSTARNHMVSSNIGMNKLLSNNTAAASIVEDTAFLTAITNDSGAFSTLLNSTTGMTAVAASRSAMSFLGENESRYNSIKANSSADSIFHDSQHYGEILNANTGASTIGFGSVSNIADSPSKMDVITANPAALTELADSDAAMSTLANSATAMNTIANSQTAINTLGTNANAADKMYDSSVAISAFESSSLKQTETDNSPEIYYDDVVIQPDNTTIILSHTFPGGRENKWTRDNQPRYGASNTDFPYTADRMKSESNGHKKDGGFDDHVIEYIDITTS